MRRRGSHGFGLVEVLVALGILAVVAAALLALQAASLRATRAANLTRDLAAAAEAEARLRSALATPGPGCLVATRWPAVATCEVAVSCPTASCGVRLHAVRVTAVDGRELTVVGAGPVAGALGASAAEPGGSAP